MFKDFENISVVIYLSKGFTKKIVSYESTICGHLLCNQKNYVDALLFVDKAGFILPNALPFPEDFSCRLVTAVMLLCSLMFCEEQEQEVTAKTSFLPDLLEGIGCKS